MRPRQQGRQLVHQARPSQQGRPLKRRLHHAVCRRERT
nr:MAG TPA: hypothetical protein [Caudoviricetes sp.]DAV42351.1 MAG TPA: hypothetical protein [Caudoviricetes sp.]